MADEVKGIVCIAPSRLGVGEGFVLKVKVLGPVRRIDCSGSWRDRKPRLHSPFNRNTHRKIHFHDNCLPEWRGDLIVDGGPGLSGEGSIIFDGENQGVFDGDTRPVREFGGFRFTEPGFHFIKLTDPVSGVEAWSNAIHVTERAPAERLFWGDPHWQTFFSDGIRCPEELYAFARDEGFLDFGAITDHVEAVTDRQWDYFVAVTNDYNEDGRFATLVGLEWTQHKAGHRNVYYRGDRGPVIRSTDPHTHELCDLWRALDQLEGIEAIAVPHHSANETMGCDWSLGWNPKYEKAIEVYSVWGSSERHRDDGNPRPIQSLGGEVQGRHVVDALKLGFRVGFVGGGDVHDGRPGDAMHNESYPPKDFETWPQGLTACLAPSLSRENVFDAIRDRRTYATTHSRIYLDVREAEQGGVHTLQVEAASEEGIREVVVVRNGEDSDRLLPSDDPRVVQATAAPGTLGEGEFCYMRVVTEQGNMAWSSPVLGPPG